MNKKSPCLLAAIALLVACTPAFAADAGQPAPGASCSTERTPALPWLQLSTCPQAFCNDDDDCRALCPSDPGAFCNLSTWTCTYSSGSTGSGGSCQSGSVCAPARFCNDHSDCASCDGCSGYCASDWICRVL